MESLPPAHPFIVEHQPGVSGPSRDPFVGLKISARRAREEIQPEVYSMWESQGKQPARTRDHRLDHVAG